MRQLVDLARRLAKVDSTVLITGESGSGKERIARLVHEESTRAAGPFIAVNCGAITETLLESELFGHAHGAFTGATRTGRACSRRPTSGTLLLDEIGEVSPGMQVKLLRALQEREIRRVGENKSRPVDVRMLAATNRDLAHGVAGGTFRQDLYYRLKVVELHVPPCASAGRHPAAGPGAARRTRPCG
jgi:two-component system response regulator HydG